jgi:hypothetical protein
MAEQEGLPLGQKVISPSAGAKSNDSFEAGYSQIGDAGAASLPKVEMPVCNTPMGQQVK